jgi:hypothetical protein
MVAAEEARTLGLAITPRLEALLAAQAALVVAASFGDSVLTERIGTDLGREILAEERLAAVPPSETVTI